MTKGGKGGGASQGREPITNTVAGSLCDVLTDAGQWYTLVSAWKKERSRPLRLNHMSRDAERRPPTMPPTSDRLRRVTCAAALDGGLGGTQNQGEGEMRGSTHAGMPCPTAIKWVMGEKLRKTKLGRDVCVCR